MNETERIELLRAVAECAPKEMMAEFTASVIVFWGNNAHARLENDLEDATGCIAMLDAMEKANDDYDSCHVNEVSFSGTTGSYNCGGDIAAGDGYIHFIHEQGATRAEAIARAFVAVFQKQGNPAR